MNIASVVYWEDTKPLQRNRTNVDVCRLNLNVKRFADNGSKQISDGAVLTSH